MFLSVASGAYSGSDFVGNPSRIVAMKAIVEAGIVVMGHVGLTPQAISVFGGFRPQGRNVASAVKGPANKSLDYATCHGNFHDCPGNYGYLNLALPVFNVGYLGSIMEILKCL
ncbi:hypothetical protein VNO80_01021 [Phaseolus coccineus]|uniref:3-methyl-2-oxobutanoate hydroxymethyltransferase n=1 Tax=Phaseolus coccineus TaxID=3886 RepID=A0AAN9RMH3_PHACN